MTFGRSLGFQSKTGSLNPDNTIAKADEFDYGLFLRPVININYKKLSITAEPRFNFDYNEYEKKYERWRSYGYLFGYPSYAVDFFVAAGKSEDSTKLFVKRDFFAIPVFAGETGHFTYAIPKGYLPSSIDSSIYNKAIPTLNKYKRARIMYTKNGQTKAFKLFKKLN